MREPGNTPLVEVDGVFAKLECANPCGSIKDRIAKYIIDESENNGLLKKGMKIVEATSGNTGISMSYYAASKGYDICIVMPENMTEERQIAIKKLGADLVLCDAGDFKMAARIRDEMAQKDECFNPDQFSNPLNTECHEKTTGQEILRQIAPFANKVDAFVAGIGTGGTLIGVGHALRAVNPEVHIAALEPSESAVMSGEEAGLHGIPGIGDGFIPPIATNVQDGLHEMIDEVICISSEDARKAAMDLEKRHGFCVGISSGANYLGALQLANRFQTVVTIFPDGYAKYQSAGLRHCGRGRCKHEDETGPVFSFFKKGSGPKYPDPQTE